MASRFALLPFLILGFAVGCGGADKASILDEPLPGEDSGATGDETSTTDSATGDETTPTEDAEPGEDTGVGPTEDAPPPLDTGAPPPVDSGTPLPDTAVPDLGPVDGGPPCMEPGGRTFGGHCYFPINYRSWNAARDFCVSRSAHLVTITSAAEQTFVQSINSGDRWIGLARGDGPVSPASYRWITGETSAYTNWEMGEPNGSGSCARLRGDGRWADYSCTQNLLGICERE